jgi:hypothetical protein
MFTANRKYSSSDTALVQRFCEIHEISDWRELPREQRLGMVFESMPSFWKARAEWLKTSDVADLLAGTPIEGAHSIAGTPANRRLNG